MNYALSIFNRFYEFLEIDFIQIIKEFIHNFNTERKC